MLLSVTSSHYYEFEEVSIPHSEKAMATHSSTFAWRIPWVEEPGGLQSMGLQGVGHDWSDLAAAEGIKAADEAVKSKQIIWTFY